MTVSTAAASSLEQKLRQPNQMFYGQLDFMRSVAVMMVVVDHTSLALHVPKLGPFSLAWLGLIGVLFFFVHTTLVLMWSLERKPYILDFYIRRVFRIYPLAMAAIAIAALLHAPLMGTLEDFFQYRHVSPGNLLTALLLVFNLAPAHLHYHPIVSVVWTLPLEMDMYLLLPALFAFSYRLRVRWPLVLVWLLTAATISNSGLLGGMSFLCAVPCFLPGAIAYIGYRSVRPRLPSWSFPLFLAILTVLLLMRPDDIRACWCLSLALGLGLPYFQGFRSRLLTKISHTVAKYSYGIYLSHPFALLLGVYLLPGHSRLLQLTVEALSIVVISVTAYHLLELPAIRLGVRLAARLEVAAVQRPEGSLDLRLC